jgi:zinc and cadmium transporter
MCYDARMVPFVSALVSVIVVSLVSLIGLFALSFREDALRKIVFFVVSIATGALFGDALFHLIPEAVEELGAFTAPMIFVALGILGFFILEKFFHWHHHHTGLEGEHPEACPPLSHTHTPQGPLAKLVLTSDTLHNLLDGIVIGAAYLASFELGLATTVAIILHEIPQEIGDFGILLHAGLSRWKALLFNFFTALSAIAGTLLVFLIPNLESFVPYVVAFAAGNFLYVAGSDLVPELHKTREPLRSGIQLIGIIGGLVAMFLLLFLE